jgi:hypothetical protein
MQLPLVQIDSAPVIAVKSRMTTYETPFQTILTQSDCLALSFEQRRTLELLDIDFRSEAIQLSSQRQLLELDDLRNRLASGSRLGAYGRVARGD